MFDFKLLGRPGMVSAERLAEQRARQEKDRVERFRAVAKLANAARTAPPAVTTSSKVVLQAAVAPPGGDDETDRADFANPKLRAAAQREKNRVLAILTSPAGLRNPQVAVNIAIMTALPRGQAVAMIEALESSSPSRDASADTSLARRIVRAGNRRRGEEPVAPSTVRQGQGHRATSQEILAAGRKARGEV
jgi:hypothetical protein